MDVSSGSWVVEMLRSLVEFSRVFPRTRRRCRREEVGELGSAPSLFLGWEEVADARWDEWPSAAVDAAKTNNWYLFAVDPRGMYGADPSFVWDKKARGPAVKHGYRIAVATVTDAARHAPAYVNGTRV